MRFFTTLEKAGRLEYFLVNIVLGAISYAVTYFVLSVSLDVNLADPEAASSLEEGFAFDSTALPLFLVFSVVIIFLQIINVCRRLKDLRMGYAWALLILVPLVNLVFGLYLLFVKGADRTTFTPFGNDPYDPNSWVPPASPNSGPAVSYRGEDLYLPGEEGWDHGEQAA